MEISDNFQKCLQIQCDDKHFPSNICHSCTNILINTSSFIEMVQEANKKLNSLVNNSCLEDLKPLFSEPDHTEEIASNSEVYTLNEYVSYLKQDVGQHLLKSNAVDEIVNVKDNFKCPICSKSYKKPVAYKTHKLCHVELFCEICNSVFDKEWERKNHSCVQTTKEIELSNKINCHNKEIKISAGN